MLIALCFMLFAASVYDYRHGRIPNFMVLLISVLGITYRYRHSGAGGIAGYLEESLLVLIIFYPLFRIGTVGAGDVKLFAATAGYLSGKAVFCFLLSSMLISAIISMIRLLKERDGNERFLYLCSYLGQVAATGKWRLYFHNIYERKRAGICLSGPVLFSILLHIGGVY